MQTNARREEVTADQRRYYLLFAVMMGGVVVVQFALHAGPPPLGGDWINLARWVLIVAGSASVGLGLRAALFPDRYGFDEEYVGPGTRAVMVVVILFEAFVILITLFPQFA